VKLPVMPPVSPMLAKSVASIPPGASYEPKWDGFRSICFRDRDEVELGSRNERPMTRYFPELVVTVVAELPERCVIDGEIVVATDHGLDFEALQQRIHPADSRVRMLAQQTAASFIAFDLLALGDDDYTGRPFSERRAALVQLKGSSCVCLCTRVVSKLRVKHRQIVVSIRGVPDQTTSLLKNAKYLNLERYRLGNSSSLMQL